MTTTGVHLINDKLKGNILVRTEFIRINDDTVHIEGLGRISKTETMAKDNK